MLSININTSQGVTPNLPQPLVMTATNYLCPEAYSRRVITIWVRRSLKASKMFGWEINS